MLLTKTKCLCYIFDDYMTRFPWAIVVALAVLGLAFLLKYMTSDVVEDQRLFLWLAGIFILLYVLAAWAIGSLNPSILLSNLSV